MMKMQNDRTNWTEATRERAKIFDRSVPMQLAVHEVRRALGHRSAGRVLTIGEGNPLALHYLRRGEGSWEHAVPDAGDVVPVREVTGGAPVVMDGRALPFEDKTFDVVIVVGSLESAPDDEAFIHDCHRLLKNDGRLILCVRNRKRFSLLHIFQGRQSSRTMREGYTEKELFLLLKTGFDVIGMRSYTRILVEAVDRWVQTALLRGRSPVRLYAAAEPLFRVAFQLDTLFLLTRGYRWIVVGKRRLWRPRNAPVMGDGRKISEAVLSRPTN